MPVDLSESLSAEGSWALPDTYWPALTDATAHLETPLAAIDLGALRHNAHDMRRRAAGTPIRVAAKSVRSRTILDAVTGLDGYAGVLAFTLPEALWLATGDDAHPPQHDVVVGYPTADLTAIAELASSPELAARVTLMVDDVAQLDLVDSVAAPSTRPPLRVCLDLDASWQAPVLGHLGVRRSPVHTAAQAGALARTVAARSGFTLVGLMSYEAQIAGVGDDVRGQAARSQLIRWMQRRSKDELLERRGLAVSAVRQVADLEFVNGGGTGSLEYTASDPAVTEIAAGSGLFGPHLFDTYRGFTPAPAAAFALSVVRKPAPQIATVLGGGWIASGPPARDRVPLPVWPPGLSLLPAEMAGEVQTPVTGKAAGALKVGDRVWFRHCKAGELSEHVDAFAMVDDGTTVGTAPTYRGEGKTFL
ncbi:amino acid deaminase/aldolase [Mycolicibacterium mucogenicum]|uniref:Amino acid deaminase/aldolase n=1 Tax=Mycolicibacterium mucogenicum TaxID=56689 RepID=A0A4V6PMP8_MYCMU|nr:amino acid deaminase/aldolase [Mycolicibacterium mucogenicum]TDK89472.1 amino acid deaminase/aldolase [Mycolicibacterium mucogenicum]